MIKLEEIIFKMMFGALVFIITFFIMCTIWVMFIQIGLYTLLMIPLLIISYIIGDYILEN